MSAHTLLGHLVRLLYPPICACNQQVSTQVGSYVCSHCMADYWPTDHEQALVTNELYLRLPASLPLVGAFAGWHFMAGSMLQTHLHAMKYKRYAHVAQELGYRCGQRIRGAIPSDFVVMPVPLHPRKFRSRGFNQAEWVARGLAKGAGLPLRVYGATRTVHNPSQTRLSRADRMANVRGIFAVRGTPPERVLLVDDVITTGATIASLGDALVAAGTRELFVASLAVAT